MASTKEKNWTVKDLIATTAGFFKGKGITSARLDAELLLSRITKLSRIELYTNFDRLVSQSELDSFRELVRQRAEGKPVKYMLGEAEFYSLKLNITEDVLIPRPETELLIDAASDFLGGSEKSFIIDLCTGSGCIAIAVAVNYEDCEIWASDISSKALDVARGNSERHEVSSRIRFFEGDLFGAFGDELQDGTVDMIISNPPYVSEDELAGLPPEVKDFGPREALLGGIDGLDFYRKIISNAPSKIKNNGKLILELDDGQSNAVSELINQTGLMKIVEIRNDYQGIARVLIAEKI